MARFPLCRRGPQHVRRGRTASKRGTKLSRPKIALLVAAPVALLYVSLFVGRYVLDPLMVMRILASRIVPIARDWPATAETIVLQIRLPRTILAACVGAGLSVSGAAYQGMFRNPLVSTDILGVSAAAGFGAAFAILLGASPTLLQLMSFSFGLVGVALTYSISRVHKTTPALMLVLSGIVVGAFFNSLVSATKYLADPENRLPGITYWLLGSFSSASYANLAAVVPLIALGTTGLLLIRWRLNILAMGDEEARSLGVKTELLKGIVIFCTTLITAAAVSVSGLVGWVGLVVPHVGRMAAGPNHKVLLPTCLAIGAAYLIAIDMVARTATAGEIPLGILTAIIGAPVFALLLRKTDGGWK